MRFPLAAARFAFVLSHLALPGIAAAQGSGFLPPSIVTQSEVPYPSAILEAPHGPEQRLPELDVELEVVLDAKGQVLAVNVVVSGGADFDQQAMAAVRTWKFAPASRDGVATASKFHIPIHFEPPPHAEPTLDVQVRGKTRSAIRGASDYRLEVGELDLVPRRTALELLTLAPGVFLTRDGGEGHAPRIYMRGFDAGEGQDVAFSVDGVPVNESGNYHGGGLSDLNFMIPELVTGVRVVEGPFDPRQGNYAVAGSADYELGLTRRGLMAQATYGSWNTTRLLTTFGPQGESKGTYAAAEVYHSDGYGQNRQALRGRAMAGYEGKLGDASSFRLTASGYATEYKSAGLLREDQVASGEKDFYDTNDARQGGSALRFHTGFDIESRVGDSVFGVQTFAVYKASRSRENETGFVEDPQLPGQSPHPQRGDLHDLTYRAGTFGLKSFARQKIEVFDLEQSLEAGLFARGDVASNLQQRILADSEVPYLTDADFTANIGDIGLYLDLNARFAPWLSLRGGLRAEAVAYQVDDRCAAREVPPGTTSDLSCQSQQSTGAYREPNQESTSAALRALPRVALVLGPFAGLSYSLSYGQGIRAIDPIYIAEGSEAQFASIDSGDLGISYARGFDTISVKASNSFFLTHVDRDLVFNQAEGRSTLADGTTRAGVATGVRITGDFFDESASVSLVSARFDDTGLPASYVPAVIFRNDAALFHDLFDVDDAPLRGRIGIGVTAVGRRPMPGGLESDLSFDLDAALAAEWRFLALTIEGQNLANLQAKQAEFVYESDFDPATPPDSLPRKHFAAAPPLGVFVSLSATLGGDR